jgi:hypothetical protein
LLKPIKFKRGDSLPTKNTTFHQLAYVARNHI